MLLVHVKIHFSNSFCCLNLLFNNSYFSHRNREILELGLDNEDSEHENDEDTNQSKMINAINVK